MHVVAMYAVMCRVCLPVHVRARYVLGYSVAELVGPFSHPPFSHTLPPCACRLLSGSALHACMCVHFLSSHVREFLTLGGGGEFVGQSL